MYNLCVRRENQQVEILVLRGLYVEITRDLFEPKSAACVISRNRAPVVFEQRVPILLRSTLFPRSYYW